MTNDPLKSSHHPPQAPRKRMADLSEIRKNFALQLLHLLSKKTHEAQVVGLRADWGTGKTSILEAIKTEIKESHPSIRVTSFNPWLYGEKELIAKKFFEHIALQIGIVTNKTEVDALELFEAMGVVPGVSVLKKIPFTPVAAILLLHLAIFIYYLVGDWTGYLFSYAVCFLVSGGLYWVFSFNAKFKQAVSRRLKQAHTLLTDWGIVKRDEDDIREKLKAGLSSAAQSLLVIIDDIDRLRPDEIREVFSHIRNHADLPNITFLVAYSSEQVARAHDSAPGAGDGDKYIEKLIQRVYDLPVLPWEDMEKDLCARVTELTGNRLHPDETSRWEEFITYGHARRLLSSPRDIHRLMDSMDVVYDSLMKDGNHEVNFGDLLALEAIRHTDPEFYKKMPSLKTELLTHRISDYDSAWSVTSLAEFDRSSENVIPAQILPVIRWLFPKWGFSSDSESGYKRIADKACFDRYFQFSLVSGQFSEAEFKKFVQLSDSAAQLACLKDYAERRVLGEFTARIDVWLREPDRAGAGAAFLPALLKFEEMIPSTYGSLFPVAVKILDAEANPKELLVSSMQALQAVELPARLILMKYDSDADLFTAWLQIVEALSLQELSSSSRSVHTFVLLKEKGKLDFLFQKLLPAATGDISILLWLFGNLVENVKNELFLEKTLFSYIPESEMRQYLALMKEQTSKIGDLSESQHRDMTRVIMALSGVHDNWGSAGILVQRLHELDIETVIQKNYQSESLP